MSTDPLIDLQLDGLPGPTTFHGGLSAGNLASQANAGTRANPRAAARQCLAKMRLVMSLGVPQAFLPPLARPHLGFLRRLGMAGTDAEVVAQAGREEPQLLHIASSSASMWTANCATVIPAADARDGYCHLIPANLSSMAHRALEAAERAPMLRRLFGNGQRYMIHAPLPDALGDEGAANHHRAQGPLGACHLFVHGRTIAAEDRSGAAESAAAGTAAPDPGRPPARHPARQWREASAAVARLGQARQVLHARQHPDAIAAGAFHNDVVMVGQGARLLLHERALVDQAAVLAELQGRCGALQVVTVSEAELSLAQAVRCYLFNSQLLDTPHGTVLLAPIESSDGPARRVVDRLRESGFIARVEFVDLRESMMGGGGPACLRLRIPLTREALAEIPAPFLISEDRLRQLEQWVDRHYRRELSLSDLRDPRLLAESRAALDELSGWFGGTLYALQGSVS